MNRPGKRSESTLAPATRELLRSLPAATELLSAPELASIHSAVGHGELLIMIQMATDRLRQEILAGKIDLDPTTVRNACVETIQAAHRENLRRRLGPVINATGILLHTNLGRSPLAAKVLERMSQVGGYANVELDLASGRRSGRGERATELLARLTGAEAALVVNNCAAATMLALAATSTGRETIISRSQLVEIGGGFRLPDVFAASGTQLKEVGTTNRTYQHDYQRAIGETTGAILRVHRSNFSLEGFVAEPTIEGLMQLDTPEDVAIIDDVGSGCLYDLSGLGLTEPNAKESVAAGADLVLFSGDKLFGGPQAGIVVGKSRWVDTLRAHPMMRAMRVDKSTLAGIEATCEIHLSGRHREELPLYTMMYRSQDQLRERAEFLCNRLSAESPLQAKAVQRQCAIGGGTLPGFTLPSWCVSIRSQSKSTTELARALRIGAPAVQGRVQEDQLLCDMRSILDGQFEELFDALCAAECHRKTDSQGLLDASH
ncbi:MAG: L-seryl-tRNA(Sec) selenium transferase [Aureliella sp.]